tara:strand:+ start:196 stop:2424 length:2229 start_codon:yes stop_codon:yes gene_type:complete
MANQYTITTSSTTEFQGDSIAAGTLAASYTLTITPDTGRVIQASDFSIGTTLPIEVASVSFADTGTALTPANTITVSVFLAQWYQMPAANTQIDIDIDGTTHPYQPTLNFTLVNNTALNITQLITATNKTTTTIGSIVTDVCFLPIQETKKTLVAEYKAIAASGHYIQSRPTFTTTSKDSSRWSIEYAAETINSNNFLTEVTVELYYNMGSEDISLSNGEVITFSTPTAIADRVSYASIFSIEYSGYKNESILDSDDRVLDLIIKGSPDSTYEVKIEDQIGLTYDFSEKKFNRTPTNLQDQKINIATRSGFNTHRIELQEKFPETALFDNNFYKKLYTTTVTPTGSTKTSSDGTSAEPLTTKLNWFGQVDYTLSIGTGTYGVNVASPNIKVFSNKEPLSNFAIANAEDIEFNPGYFSSSQVLGYTVAGTVSSHSHPSTDVTLTATHASLKLQAGDAVSGTGVAVGATIASFPSGSVIRLSAVSTETISGTLTFVRNVGISRQPTEDDIVFTSPFSTTKGGSYDINYSVVHSTSDSKFLKVDPSKELVTDDGITNIADGMLVQGKNIIGYPVVSSFTPDGDIVLSTKQTLDSEDVLRFSISGSSLKINEVSVTNPGTATCTLNIKGYVERIGIQDVNANLALANFITAYTAPVAVAITAECQVGDSVVIRPLDSITTSTVGNLTVSTVSKASSTGAAFIGSDKKSIIFVAAAQIATATETITYEISDGINESSAANIVITIIP